MNSVHNGVLFTVFVDFLVIDFSECLIFLLLGSAVGICGGFPGTSRKDACGKIGEKKDKKKGGDK